MGMTMTQKILAAHAGLDHVEAGQLITARLDLVLANDITGPVSINEFEKAGFGKVFDKSKIALVMDHFVPNKDIKSAEQCKKCRTFARRFDIDNFFDVGEMGIEHSLLPEKGLVASGEAVIGADSHTCTYGALGAFSTGVGSTDLTSGMATGQTWFKVPSALKFNLTGELQKNVSGKDVILHIFCICNMAIEAGGKNGIFPVDDKTIEYMKGRVDREYKVYAADEDAEYDEVYEINLSEIRPTVSFPHLPENTKTIDEVKAMEPVIIDQVVIGSCTNGRLSDMKTAADILRGKHVARGLRVIIIPATQTIYKECIKLGYIEDFIDAGCVVSTPTCGPCLGGYMGILAEGERAVATTNRNFVGRMGHVKSEVYLASPAVAAASALAGRIAGPDEI